jgi:hypothetical protein
MIKKTVKILSFALLFLSLCSAVFMLSLLFYKHKSKRADLCTYIAQTGPRKEALSLDYLAALLELPLDRPVFLSDLDLKAIHHRLLAQPVIAEAIVTRERGGVLLIDYTLRAPIAFLGDFPNLAMDREGCCFPFFPFFTPKNIPTVYLGLEALPSFPLRGKKINLALAFFQMWEKSFPRPFPKLVSIDLSHFSRPCLLASREIVLTAKTKKGDTHYLRLSPDIDKDPFKRYAMIADQWEGDFTFDLRIDRLAFVKLTRNLVDII